MRIVQTFWTAGQDPLKCSFGWLHAEYNLMSWALSCLSLRRHYDEVALYTDSVGKHVLIDLLHLPYTEVNVVFDGFKCLPHHWALAKVHTYSLQEKPFIHVDGDVYRPNAVNDRTASSPLIAQNREVGTSYYRDMMERVIHNPDITLPECIVKTVEEDALSSYNMGVFGGNDLDFIRRYCDEVFSFFKVNRLNDNDSVNRNIECNIFFEQIILAALADTESMDVAYIIDRLLPDEGYSVEEFCDFDHFGQSAILHLLGGHKRNKRVVLSLKHHFVSHHYSVFRDLVLALDGEHDGTRSRLIRYMSPNPHLEAYFRYVDAKLEKWESESAEDRILRERDIAGSAAKVQNFIADSCPFRLTLNPSVSIYSFGKRLSYKSDEPVFKWFNCIKVYPLADIAVRSSFCPRSYESVPLKPMDLKIIKAIQSGNDTAARVMEVCVSPETKAGDRKAMEEYVMMEILFLVRNEILMIVNK